MQALLAATCYGWSLVQALACLPQAHAAGSALGRVADPKTVGAGLSSSAGAWAVRKDAFEPLPAPVRRVFYLSNDAGEEQHEVRAFVCVRGKVQVRKHERATVGK